MHAATTRGLNFSSFSFPQTPRKPQYYPEQSPKASFIWVGTWEKTVGGGIYHYNNIDFN